MLPESVRLAANVAQALRATGPDLARSLLGEPESRSLAHCAHSEFQVLTPESPLRSLETAAHLLIPALPRRPPAWVRLRPWLKPAARLLLRPSKVYRFRPARPRPDPSPDQAWFFINGICTDRRMLMLNAAYLHDLFGRPLTLLHNSTCGVLPDLLECAVGKHWNGVTEATRMSFAPIYSALKQPGCRRVVLLAHSRGSLIAGVLLWLLRGLYAPTAHELLAGEPRCPEQRVARALAERWSFPCAQSVAERLASPAAVRPPLSRAELAKLEVYAFANCTSLMEPADHSAHLPYLESYGNEFDAVARLGVLAPAHGIGAARVGGERFLRRDAWGHLLNAHYLQAMEQEWRASAADGGALRTGLSPLPGNRARLPRLFGYFNGASPVAIEATEREVPARETSEPSEPEQGRRWLAA